MQLGHGRHPFIRAPLRALDGHGAPWLDNFLDELLHALPLLWVVATAPPVERLPTLRAGQCGTNYGVGGRLSLLGPRQRIHNREGRDGTSMMSEPRFRENDVPTNNLGVRRAH